MTHIVLGRGNWRCACVCVCVSVLLCIRYPQISNSNMPVQLTRQDIFLLRLIHHHYPLQCSWHLLMVTSIFRVKAQMVFGRVKTCRCACVCVSVLLVTGTLSNPNQLTFTFKAASSSVAAIESIAMCVVSVVPEIHLLSAYRASSVLCAPSHSAASRAMVSSLCTSLQL